MNEIEKLYKLAGCAKYVCAHKVQKYCDENIGCRDPYFNPYPLCEGEKCDKEYKNIVFDEYECCFTAEKQLELIKWLSSRYLNLSKYHDVVTDKYMYGIRTDVGTYAYCHREKFEEMIAGLIIELWQDLTEEEKEQIRSILNG